MDGEKLPLEVYRQPEEAVRSALPPQASPAPRLTDWDTCLQSLAWGLLGLLRSKSVFLGRSPCLIPSRGQRLHNTCSGEAGKPDGLHGGFLWPWGKAEEAKR